MMSQRESNLLWLKDMLDHLRACQQELQAAEDAETVQLLTESMLRELECCRRVCEALRWRSSLQHVY
jgi:hypothetical protein